MVMTGWGMVKYTIFTTLSHFLGGYRWIYSLHFLRLTSQSAPGPRFHQQPRKLGAEGRLGGTPMGFSDVPMGFSVENGPVKWSMGFSHGIFWDFPIFPIFTKPWLKKNGNLQHIQSMSTPTLKENMS